MTIKLKKLKKNNGVIKTPDGKGKALCIKFEDYIKYKYTKKELYWEEDHNIKIFPDCIRPKENITEE